MAVQCTHVSGSREERKAAYQGMRRVPEDGRHVGASAHVPGVRACGLLRLVEEPPCARRIFMRRSIRSFSRPSAAKTGAGAIMDEAYLSRCSE